MANLLLKFGATTLPPTFYVEKWPTLRNVPSAKIPRADGARTLTGYLDGKTWQLKGALVGGSEPIPTGSGYLRAQLDALRAALEAGPATFQTHDDRYFRNCQVSQFEEQYTATVFGRGVEITCDVIAGDPFAYEFASQSATQALSASGQTLAATPGGNAYALPVVALTIGAGGLLTATVTNQTNGDACTLTGAVGAGDVYLIDSLNKAVTLQSLGADKLLLFDGLFPRLVVGANVLRVDFVGGTASVSSVGLTWQNRWW